MIKSILINLFINSFLFLVEGYIDEKPLRFFFFSSSFFSQPKMGFHVAGESEKQKKLGDLRGRREAKQVSPLPLVKAGNDDKQAMKLRIL